MEHYAKDQIWLNIPLEPLTWLWDLGQDIQPCLSFLFLEQVDRRC